MELLTRKALKQLSKNQLIEIILMQQEQLVQIKEMMQKQIDMLTAENKELRRRIAKLEKDSNNSSKPPSTDIKKQNSNKPKRNQTLRKTSNNKPGGQPGHKGTTRKQTPNPDNIELCEPHTYCSCCGGSLENIMGNIVEKRQVVDIPPINPTVTEYQAIEKVCTCGHHNRGTFPEGVNAPMQMGSSIQSFLVYLNVAQVIPFKRLKNLCSDLFNLNISKRTIENILEKANVKGKSVKEEILNIVKNSEWVGSDETGKRVEGKRWWEWVWQSLKATIYVVDKCRGYCVVKSNFGEDFKGILIHDCWSAQNNTRASGHQQCHAHIQRELQFLIGTYKSSWAYELDKFLGATQRARIKIWKEDFDDDLREQVRAQYEQRFDSLLNSLQTEPDIVRLQKRLKKHRKSILRFMYHPDIPFHNNSSEQAIRMAKVKQKISGCFRSEHAAHRHATLLSIIETAKKQNMNILLAIQNLFSGTLVLQST